MKLLLNPKYEHLRHSLENIQDLMRRGTVIHNGRNRLCIVKVEGISICIKEYKIPHCINRVVYRFLRPTKGLRAWKHSDILRQAGFDSPENVAYIQNNTFLAIGICYYVSLYKEGKTLYDWGNKSLDEIQLQVRSLAQLTAHLHDSRLLLQDYTPGNILQSEHGFFYVDTNRMRRGLVSLEDGLRNMAGLWMQPEVADYLAEQYIEARGNRCTEQHIANMRFYRRIFWKRLAQKQHIQTEKVHQDLDGSKYYFNIQSTIQ